MKPILFCVLLIAIQPVTAVYITEVMYNPEGSDNNQEYVEMYSELYLNFTSSLFKDLESTDALTLIQEANSSFYLIVEEGFNYTGINATIYTTGATIGNNLNNERDMALIEDITGQIIDFFYYNNTYGGDNDGKALCKETPYEGGYPCDPTPGGMNTPIEDSSADNSSDDEGDSDTFDYSSLLINEFFPDPNGSDDAPLPNGEWIEIYNSGNNFIDTAGLTFTDKGNNNLIITNNNVVETTYISPKGFLVVYANGKSMLNNNGFEKLILSFQDNIIHETSYVDSKKGMTWSKFDDTYILAPPTPGEENVEPPEPQEEESKSSGSSGKQHPQEHSYLSIDEINVGNDNIAHFGDTITVKLNLYKGDTKKSVVRVSADQISKSLTFKFNTEQTSYNISLPLQLDHNCDNKLRSGNYNLTVTGFDQSASKSFSVSNKTICSMSSLQQSLKTGLNTPQAESFINKETSSTLIYQSADKRAQTYAIYLFFLATVMIVGYFVRQQWKNKKSG